DPYVTTIARWRSRVTARPSSSHEFPIAHTPPRRAPRCSEAFRRWCAAPLSTWYPPTTSESSSGDSSERPMHLSSHSARPSRKRCRSSVDSVPSFTPVMRSLAPTHVDLLPPRKRFRDSYSSEARCTTSIVLPSEGEHHGRSEAISSLEIHQRDPAFSSTFAGPSRKRCRSPVDSVPLSMPVTGSLAPTRVNLSPPHKRFRDSYSSEASLEEDAEVGLTGIGVDMELGIGDGDEVGDHVEIDHRDARDDTEEYEADASAGDTAEVGIDPMTALLVEEEIVEPVGEDSPDSSGTRDGIRRLEADQLIASGDRARMAEMIYSLRLENLKVRAMLDIERDRVSSLRLHMSLSQGSFDQMRWDLDDARGRLARTMTNTRSDDHAAIEEMIDQRVNAALEAHRVNQNLELGNGNDNGNDNGNGNGIDNGNDNGNGNGNAMGSNGNGNGNGNNGGDNGDGNENHNVNGRGDRLVARECTYQDFMKCQPTSFKGTEGVVGLIRWSEKMETVFHISKNVREKYQSELMKLMTEVYCPRNEIQKMETELWNLSVKNNDIANYTHRFQELTMMCTPTEPTRLQDAVRIANNLMDQKLKGYAVRNAENKRRLDNNYGNNRGQQPPHKRQNTRGQNVARAYVAGNNEERQYEGTLPPCNKCKLHHVGLCTTRCGKCNKIGHLTRNCRVTNPTTPTQIGQMVNQRVVTCFECGAQGHYPHRGKKARVPNARGRAYALGGGDVNPGSNTVTGTFGMCLITHTFYL
ncbi:putative reverse transcriptase domain-containing protein, partial [Tanacetum coccineum]